MREERLPTILHVDDDEANRYAVTRILQRAGFEVWEAKNGAEALQMAAEVPDLVILDVNLPDISGLEVCRRIKAQPATSSLLVLHLSATAVQSEARAEGLEGGGDAYLIQPVEPRELIATVNALLRIRRAEETAQASARQWQTTFDAISDGVCLLDARGRVLRCNRAIYELFGEAAPPTEDPLAALGAEFLRIKASLPLAAIQDTRLRETREIRSGERWFLVTADPVVDAAGTYTGAVCILCDITERKQTEAALQGMAEERSHLIAELQQRAEALADADRRKNAFLAMLAHELRNPLGAISNAVYLLDRVGSPEGPAARSRATISRQLGHLTRMVDDLLDVTRITRGKMDLRKEWVDLAAVAQQAVQTSMPLIQEAGHELTVSLPPHPLHLEADPTRLVQVLANLLNNAAKYTSPGSRISLTVEREGVSDSAPLQDRQDGQERAGVAVIRVRDTGVGIPAETLPHVFDLFMQEERSLDRAQGGLGIGLTMVKSLVELHGGTVAAFSAGQDQGSEFVVRLPLGAREEMEGSPQRHRGTEGMEKGLSAAD